MRQRRRTIVLSKSWRSCLRSAGVYKGLVSLVIEANVWWIVPDAHIEQNLAGITDKVSRSIALGRENVCRRQIRVDRIVSVHVFSQIAQPLELQTDDRIHVGLGIEHVEDDSDGSVGEEPSLKGSDFEILQRDVVEGHIAPLDNLCNNILVALVLQLVEIFPDRSLLEDVKVVVENIQLRQALSRGTSISA